jgi:hypothetical protein
MQSTYTAYTPTSIVEAEGFIRQGHLHCTTIECLHCSAMLGPTPSHSSGTVLETTGSRRPPVRKKAEWYAFGL